MAEIPKRFTVVASYSASNIDVKNLSSVNGMSQLFAHIHRRIQVCIKIPGEYLTKHFHRITLLTNYLLPSKFFDTALDPLFKVITSTDYIQLYEIKHKQNRTSTEDFIIPLYTPLELNRIYQDSKFAPEKTQILGIRVEFIEKFETEFYLHFQSVATHDTCFPEYSFPFLSYIVYRQLS